MATVTIKGSIMPCGELPRGEIAIVQRTAHIDNLIRQGFVDVVEENNDAPPKVVAPESVVPPAVDPAPAQPSTTPYDLDNPPHKGASKDTWAEFLASFPTGIVTAGKSRDQLVGAWEEYLDEHPRPSE